jgi:hypothetical protein
MSGGEGVVVRKIFSRFRAIAGGEAIDGETAFEVVQGSIKTHDVKTSGFFSKKVEYTPRYTHPIDSTTQIDLRLAGGGSGMCEVRTGMDRVDYHVYGNAQEFANEVLRRKDTAR